MSVRLPGTTYYLTRPLRAELVAQAARQWLRWRVWRIRQDWAAADDPEPTP